MGQKNGRARIWAKRGTRPRLPADQRYTNAYLFGAICPRSGKGAALMLPFANTRAMQMHLDEISCNVAAKAHGVVLMDRAGWHSTGKLKVPKNLTIILLPSRSPELNPVENIWQYLRQNWLSNHVFEDYHAIIEAGCQAWNKLRHRRRPVHFSVRIGSIPWRMRSAFASAPSSRLWWRRKRKRRWAAVRAINAAARPRVIATATGIDLVQSLSARLRSELERRFGLNSTNSGKPPCSDGLSMPPAEKQKRRSTGSHAREVGL